MLTDPLKLRNLPSTSKGNSNLNEKYRFDFGGGEPRTNERVRSELTRQITRRITAAAGIPGVMVGSASARGQSMTATEDTISVALVLGRNTFGLFNTFTTTTTDAIRPFTGVLTAGDTFSIDLGFSTFAATGSVGINLRSGTNEVITLFTTGSGDWMLNDGGGEFQRRSRRNSQHGLFFFPHLQWRDQLFLLADRIGWRYQLQFR